MNFSCAKRFQDNRALAPACSTDRRSRQAPSSRQTQEDMLLYAAALAAMFVCQNGLTGVIQAPPRRPRPPRKAASRGPLKGDAPNPLGPITITTPARPTRWLLVALASLARAGHDSEETYVIQALRPEAIPSLDVAVPDGVSSIALSEEALVLPMLGLFVELYENRHRDGKVVSLSSLESAGDGAADVVTPPEPPSIARSVLRERRLPRTVNGTGHTGPSEFCATSI